MPITTDPVEIIRELAEHVINFVEQPQPMLANLPICPFAQKPGWKIEVSSRFWNLPETGLWPWSPRSGRSRSFT
jgi:hypothetical protein